MPFVPLFGGRGGWVNLAKVCGDILGWCSHQSRKCKSHLEVAEKTNGCKFPFGFLKKLMAKDWFGGLWLTLEEVVGE